MSLSWPARKAQLAGLLNSQGNEDEDALELDRLLHGQSVIGKTSKTIKVDSLRFQDSDLQTLGRLARGQFGVIDVVRCRLDGRVYVRKSIEKCFALRNRDQCFPQFERDILLRATRSDSLWAPHLLCSFHTSTHLSLVMDYAECGTLWDVLESSPHDGRVPESDLRWWTPQLVSAIHWCHSQGFAHRDIKPHNFVLTTSARILLIDFGSAAPLLPPRRDWSRALPKRYCLVPCGTCDYISPEILRAHEEALVALEMDCEGAEHAGERDVADEEGYGWETDWWSMGAMLYEMAYGVAPFFAKDIRHTYLKIMDHKHSMRFNSLIPVSSECRDLLCRLLTDSEQRLGRRSINEFLEHPFFNGVQWESLHDQPAPYNLHLPQFVDCEPANDLCSENTHASISQPFAFSAFFQSSATTSPGLSALHSTPSRGLGHSLSGVGPASTFIGFSWGPTLDAFPDQAPVSDDANDELHGDAANPYITTPRPARPLHAQLTPHLPLLSGTHTSSHPFTTPIRPSTLTPHHSLPRTSTSRRTAPRRSVSDREAMQQLVDCVGMSARKKVLESGRKPRVLTSFSRSGTVKELRFLVHDADKDKDNDSEEDVKGGRDSSRLGGVMPVLSNSSSEDTDTEGPPSPSPSPRPGSAMSRRSATPTTTTTTYSQRIGTVIGSTSNATTTLPPVNDVRPARRLDGKRDHGEDEPLDTDRWRILELEEKHALLMRDISDLEQRLCQLSTMVGDHN